MSIYIKGNYSKSIYQNDSGYHIGIFRVQDTNSEMLSDYLGRTITFTGYFHELNNIDTYMLYGELVTHDKYGEQFRVDSYERCQIEEKDAIVEFLTSGLFKGIGLKKAQAIVDTLGDDTLKIILENPSNLILIPGISKNNIDVLHNKLKEYEDSYDTIIFLTEMGFSQRDAMIIYNYYKKKTKEILVNNIYQVIDDILDITFKKIDHIALNNGIKYDDVNRLSAAVIYIMQEISNTLGHCYYYKEELYNYLLRLTGKEIDYDLFEEILKLLSLNLKIEVRDEKYYLKEMYDAETFIVKRFRLLNSNGENKIKNLDKIINDFEKLLDLKYNVNQLEAIKKSITRDFLIITGGPGTGKTTIMKAICELYRDINKYTYDQMNNKVALLAPTGRAAKRMSEVSLYKASTIHRFLKWQKETNKFQINEYNKSKVEMVIVDEASMVDTLLLASLLKGLSANCKVILIGDDHQLPSVGAGYVLHDLIESHTIEVVQLEELYRQGKDSNIITLAYDIRKSSVDKSIFNVSEDLTFIECKNNEVLDKICEVANAYKDVSYKKIQILAPMYKGINGIDEINNRLQNIFNPKDSKKKENRIGESIFREDDKVIQLTNMPDDNVYNGDIGLIESIVTNNKKEIKIDFDGNVVKYTPSNYSNFRLAYAISIHKSQGSEFDTVIIPIVQSYNKMLYQKLIYTAVTRSKKRLYLIGDFKALEIASKNIKDDNRRTTIKDFLINGIK